MTVLAALLPEIAINAAIGGRDVAGVTADSRHVKPGFVFFAIPGARSDGLDFAPAAIDAGAIAIVAERVAPQPLAAETIVAPDVRAALSKAASRFYARQPKTIVAVTGTSGKTSTTVFVRQIWARLGHTAAALGTTGVIKPSGATYGSLTTPDPVTLHKTLDELAGEGVTHLAMEASSHGLDQRRLDGVRLTVGAFTNLSRDHLDYHPTIDDYFAAKMRLFDSLLAPGQTAVIDADSEFAGRVIDACRARGLKVVSVGVKGDSIRVVNRVSGADAADLEIMHEGVAYNIRLPLAGDFMTSNALVAAGLCIATGDAPPNVFAALEHLTGAPGRLEKVGERNGAPIFVDYAHKPDALDKVLAALRPVAKKRLIVVFGCGGDRDAGKRPIMGEIAAKGADVVIVTDDNPRSEEPDKIRQAILRAAPGAREIGDRKQAIFEGVRMLEAGDVLVVAGKGHETGQIVGKVVLAFSDHETVRAALGEFAA